MRARHRNMASFAVIDSGTFDAGLLKDAFYRRGSRLPCL